MKTALLRLALLAVLLLAPLTRLVAFQSCGFFTISCASVGSPSFCAFALVNGTAQGGFGYDTGNDCSWGCASTSAAREFVGWFYCEDCDGQSQMIYVYHCCPIF